MMALAPVVRMVKVSQSGSDSPRYWSISSRLAAHLSHKLLDITEPRGIKTTVAVADSTSISKADVNRVLDGVFDTITSKLKGGGQVTFVGFGTFSTSDRAARQGRNPQTGATIQIPAQTVAKFKAGKALKEAVNSESL